MRRDHRAFELHFTERNVTSARSEPRPRETAVTNSPGVGIVMIRDCAASSVDVLDAAEKLLRMSIDAFGDRDVDALGKALG